MKNKKNIVLIGFMGAGKSAVAKELGSRLSLKAISTDELIEKEEKKKISEIFKDSSEKEFRRIEKKVIKKICRGKNVIIDCGGGVVLDDENVRNIKKNSLIFFLSLSLDEIKKRISDSGENRPLLNKNPIDKLFQSREDLYKKIADEIIETDDLSVGKVSEKIIKKIKKNIISAPPSKSFMNRVLVIASLSKGRTTIKNPCFCDDSIYLINALKKFGVKIEERKKENLIVVNGANGKFRAAPEEEIFLGNAGTSLRFMVGLAGLAEGRSILKGDKRMCKRPVHDLVNALCECGIKVKSKNSDGCPPVIVNGGNFNGGKIKLKGDNSSQYLSSILMISPFAKNSVEIEIVGNLTSKPYVGLTIDLMERFGVKVENYNFKRFKIKNNKKYCGKKEIKIEGDFSSASYFFAIAAISGNVIRVENLNPLTKQGDIKFLDILEKVGCKVKREKDWIEVKRSKILRGFDIDMNNFPDLVPTLAVVSLFAKGKTRIRNIKNLKIKETDRLSALANELRKAGAIVEELKDGLVIEPKRLKGDCKIETYNDHRMAMSFGILTLVEPNIKIKNLNCVNKSFPGFWDELKKVERGWLKDECRKQSW